MHYVVTLYVHKLRRDYCLLQTNDRAAAVARATESSAAWPRGSVNVRVLDVDGTVLEEYYGGGRKREEDSGLQEEVPVVPEAGVRPSAGQGEQVLRRLPGGRGRRAG